MKIKSFKDLVVWQLSSKLSKEVSELIKTFPASEKYALSDDLLRSARSIPSNISEGFGRYHFSEKIQFYNIAKGSTLEVQNHLIEAFNNKYILEKEKARFLSEYHIVEVKLNNLIASTAKARKNSKDQKRKKKE
jgi:four helix bundle protein